MRKIHLGLTVLVGASALVITACSSTAPTPGASGSEGAPSTSGKPYIAIVAGGFQHQFWQAVKRGAEAEAEKQGVQISFQGPSTETEIETQISMLANALAKNPAAVAYAPLDAKASEGTLQQAKAAGIPVIAFDNRIDSDVPVTSAVTDNIAAAGEAAKHMCELINGTGKVGVVGFDQVSVSGSERVKGFVETMQSECPGATVLEPQFGGGDPAKSADIAKSIIASTPDLVGMYAANEGSAIGALKGVEEASAAGKVALIGFDSGKAQKDAIRAGRMAGAITQNPVGMGEETVRSAVKAINGETLPKLINTGFYWYDKSNIDDPAIDALLYD